MQAEAAGFDQARIEYKGQSDLVSYVDRETEQLLVAGLRALLPEAGFLTEEGTVAASTTPLRWIIDPLDGTTNYLHGLPCYAVSIGLEAAGAIVLGVIYDPSRDELFHATRGGGAFCNGRPLRVTPGTAALEAPLGRALIATGFPYTQFAGLAAYLQILADFMAQSHGVRRLGSAALDLAYVAAGRFEGFFEYNLNAWDVAAGVLLVREAGGLVTCFDGAPTGGDPVHGREVLAAAPGVHAAMAAVIGRHWPPAV